MGFKLEYKKNNGEGGMGSGGGVLKHLNIQLLAQF
jgi:hypothetical protein